MKKWNTERPGYKKIHNWLRNNFGKASSLGCMICGGTKKSERFDWANLDDEYRYDLSSWTTMCRRCHIESDGRLEKFSHSHLGKHLSKKHRKSISDGMRRRKIVRSEETKRKISEAQKIRHAHKKLAL